jgi:hypothetical protein
MSVANGTRNTPLLVSSSTDQPELVVSSPGRGKAGFVFGIDPNTGKELWRCLGIPDSGYVVPSAIAHEGIVYAIGGRQNTALAVRAGGRGDVSNAHLLWRIGNGSNVASPVYHDGHLYWVHENRGIAYCLDASNGRIAYEERLTPRPGIVYASAVVADGKLYCVSQHNGTYVIAAEPTFELLAHNVFKDDNSRANAGPVVSDGCLLLRNDRYLYCIGSKQSE